MTPPKQVSNLFKGKERERGIHESTHKLGCDN